MPMRCGVPVGTGSVLGEWKNVLQQTSLLSGFCTFSGIDPFFCWTMSSLTLFSPQGSGPMNVYSAENFNQARN